MRIEELREWSHAFFETNSIKYVTWWSELREPRTEEEAIREKFSSLEVDLILKTEKVLRNKKAVEFKDHSGKQYSLYLQAPPVLAEDDVIKLRCVNV